ncbi:MULTISPECIES: calcium-binding protein [unclassified Paracoccus (in: a-proteobacteria)]|uniref:calcium-binding protein n=1 Tax=unclassified Paracoccus (in: a-proteobacteria) TaxID=2688777 RepID=UPI0012B19FB8|nr:MULTISPECIES: hypothetical protein [unclassified Paracoccus (in: a-proteobacteria)]
MPTENIIRWNTAGNDSFLGGPGIDALYWQPGGHDVFHGGDLAEAYDPNPYLERTGGDRLHLLGKQGALVVFSSTEDGVVRIGQSSLTFTGVERLHGTDGNDTIRGASAAIKPAHDGTPVHGLTIYAGAGHDEITGSRENDIIDGGSGNDTIRAGGGDDFIQSSLGHDLIYGGEGNENIRWGLGDAHWHNPGNDTIYGGGGQDLINVWVWEGGDGAGEKGADVVINATRSDGAFQGVATVGTDPATAAKATLRFQGFEQGWTHWGDDTVDGSRARVAADIGFQWNTRWGNDRLVGSAGNDTLEGGEGRDTIIGGAGNDLISTNGDFYRWDAPADADVDTLIFAPGFGHDTILAFDSDRDVLQFSAGMSYRAAEMANGTLLTFNTGDTILLANVYDFV